MIRLQAGDMVGAYRILEQVGMGGMATVYKAYHAAMDRHVAVKVMPFQFARNESFRQRFQQEVVTIARLEHPHILPVYDSGEFEGMPYLVMRYLPTGSLQDLMTERSLSMSEIDSLFTQLARALAYAHGQGVVHRDIKPANILVNERNDIFLTDFGIAKLIESTAQITASGSITGTPSYMSPEQAQGESLDARSDLYSLGILLYQMVTGRVPFEAETPLAVILKHVQASLPLPSSFKPDLHPAVETVILKALAKKPADRFQNAEAFILAWQTALAQRKADPTGEHTAPPSEALLTAAAINLGAIPDDVSFITSDTAISEPDPTFVDSAVNMPVTETAAKSRRPLWLGIGAIGLCLLVGIVAAILYGADRLQQTRNDDILLAEGQETLTEEAAASSEVTEPVRATLAPGELLNLPAGDPSWSEWANLRIINAIHSQGNQLLVGGVGGLFRWDIDEGSYQHIGMRDGLPSSSVTALFTDSEGFLWIGTDEGVVKVVGDDYTYYDVNDGLDSNSVTAITEINSAIIVATHYAGPGGGLNSFKDNSWRQLDFPSGEAGDQPSFMVNTLFVDHSNNLLLIGTDNGLATYDGSSFGHLTTADGLPAPRVNAINQLANGRLLIGTENGVLTTLEGKQEQLSPLDGLFVIDILVDSDNVAWFTGPGGIWRFDPASADWQRYSNETGDFDAFTITAGYETGNESLIFGTDGSGLLEYFDSEFRSITLENTPQQAATWNIIEDRENLLYFMEEYNCGLDSYDSQTDVWQRVGIACAPVEFGPDGAFYANNYSDGLFRDQEGIQFFFGPDQGLLIETMYDLSFIGSDVWIAGEEGVARLNGDDEIKMFRPAEIGLSDQSYFAIMADSQGQIWVGSRSGVARYDGSHWVQFEVENPFTPNLGSVTNLAEDFEGRIWVSTVGDGIWSLQGETWHQDLPDNSAVPSYVVNTVVVDKDGRTWIGTDHGAAWFNGAEWNQISPDNGFVHPNVLSIFVSSLDEVWFGTSGGIMRLQFK